MVSKTRRAVSLAVLVVLAALLVLLIVFRQSVRDWIKLLGYSPPASVVALADADTMTADAAHLFYINRPAITNSASFTQNCPAGTEKTIVLGCYKSGESGIWIYKVTDPRLGGIEQVTAAHEMLHAAYDRLDGTEKTKVNKMLESFYKTGLKSSRIKATLDSYKESEPHDIVNEMHSIFGTEVASLPAPLENYYKQYFTDRAKVVAYATDYQSEFTSRRTAVKRYDAQLASLKKQINASEAELTAQRKSLSSQRARLNSEQNKPSDYNRDVTSYNAAVTSYNQLVATTRSMIGRYNTLVDKRNAIVVEEHQLVQSITAEPQKVQ